MAKKKTTSEFDAYGSLRIKMVHPAVVKGVVKKVTDTLFTISRSNKVRVIDRAKIALIQVLSDRISSLEEAVGEECVVYLKPEMNVFKQKNSSKKMEINITDEFIIGSDSESTTFVIPECADIVASEEKTESTGTGRGRPKKKGEKPGRGRPKSRDRDDDESDDEDDEDEKPSRGRKPAKKVKTTRKYDDEEDDDDFSDSDFGSDDEDDEKPRKGKKSTRRDDDDDEDNGSDDDDEDWS